MRRFALAVGWVALAILDFERHRLQGLLVWHSARLGDKESKSDLIADPAAAEGSLH